MGEQTSDCAVRRLDEEFGIRGLTLKFRDKFEYCTDVENELIAHEVVNVFTALADDGLKIQLNPDDVTRTRQVTLEKLVTEIEDQPKMVTLWLKIYLCAHFGVIFGGDV